MIGIDHCNTANKSSRGSRKCSSSAKRERNKGRRERGEGSAKRMQMRLHVTTSWRSLISAVLHNVSTAQAGGGGRDKMNFINSLDSLSSCSSPRLRNSMRNIVNYEIIVVLDACSEYLSSPLCLFSALVRQEKIRGSNLLWRSPASPLSATRKSITSNEYNMKGIKG